MTHEYKYVFFNNTSYYSIIGYVLKDDLYINIVEVDFSNANNFRISLQQQLSQYLPSDDFTLEVNSNEVTLKTSSSYKLGFINSKGNIEPDYNYIIYRNINYNNSLYDLYTVFYLYYKTPFQNIRLLSATYRFIGTNNSGGNNGAINESQGTFEIPSFNGNGYKVNNDVIITIPKEEGKNITKCEMVVTNNYIIGARNSGLLVYYANNNEIKIPFHQIAKVMMGDPEFNDDYTTIDVNPYMYAQFLDCTIEIKRFYTVGSSNVELFDTYRSSKKFIRAGERDNKINISTQPNRLLKVTDKIPVWEGLPSPFYFVNEFYHVVRINRMLPDVPIERMQTNDCDIYYLEFANQEGGYSYWLFRSAKNSRSTTNQGYSNIYGQVKNFGNNENITHELISKVPARYMPLMHDLAISPKVRIYNGGNSWTEIIQRGNTLSYATDKRVYDVSFKFEIPTNFNPKPTW